MAIWPFGRRKRHTIQIGASDVVDIQTSYEAGTNFGDSKVSRKPSRKPSKRQKNRHLQPIDDPPSLFQNGASHPVAEPYPPPTSACEQVYHVKGSRGIASQTYRAFEPYISQSSMDHHQPSLSRSGSLLKSKRNDNGPNVLKKKLSKRKAYAIAREQEIRLMVSAPIDIPRRRTSPPSEQFSVETRRAPTARSRRSERQFSDLSLPVRGSATSSESDFSESYTFKVNSFAAWTPRPIIHYVEAPRIPTAKSQKSAEVASTKENILNLILSEENLNSRERVDTLADSMDASALRELLERDRRRKEKQKLEEQERLRRRLQRRAERQRMDKEKANAPQDHQFEDRGASDTYRGRFAHENHVESSGTGNGVLKNDETKTFLSGDTQSGSWLRDASKERSPHASLESVHVVNNIDDSSVRNHKLNGCPSFAPSQDMGMSRTTLSPSHSPSRRGLGSPNSSQVYGMARESMSDISRTVESERRLSDHSSVRGNALASLFRRGSSRLKRRYRERFQDQSSERSNTSHESFFKVSTQSSGPPPYVPPKAFLRSGTIKRPQSKFTEHFDDEPLSPPDSRLQSPDIPEEISDRSEGEEERPNLNEESQYPIPESESDFQDASRTPHRSWGTESLEYDVDNVPLAQSLASVDSEGSWMSGQFLRRISQRKSKPIRHSVSFSQPDEEREDSPQKDDVPRKEHSVRFDPNRDTISGPSDSVVDGEEEKDMVMVGAPPHDETWHSEIAKRPVVVNPSIRPKSNEGLLLRTIQSLSPISADEEVSPIEEHPSEHQYAEEENYGRAY